MTKTTKLIWRLSSLPTPSELQELVKDKIITQEEAREILFTKEDSEQRTDSSLKNEIEFLRKLVEKLSDEKKICETIKIIEKPYRVYPWYNYYASWTTEPVTITTPNYYMTTATSGTSAMYTSSGVHNSGSFSSIKTF